MVICGPKQEVLCQGYTYDPHLNILRERRSSESLNDHILNESVETVDTIIKKKTKYSKKIDELDSYLTLDINDSELNSIYKKIKATEQRIIEEKVNVVDLEQRLHSINSKLLSIGSELNKNVESYLSSVETKDAADRIEKYSNIALSVIERYQTELQKRKTDILAETITLCYRKLANKKNLISTIKMNSETLDLMYLSSEGEEIPKNTLSAGEQQLMVISILWALALCSKKKLPVIIDTPLSRLDSSHRTALIK